MTPAGWIFMIVFVGLATGGFLWCLYQVLSKSDKELAREPSTRRSTPDMDED